MLYAFEAEFDCGGDFVREYGIMPAKNFTDAMNKIVGYYANDLVDIRIWYINDYPHIIFSNEDHFENVINWIEEEM